MLILAISIFYTLAQASGLERCYSGPVSCPGIETSKICQRACGSSGAFEYKFGVNCMEGWSAVDGRCQRSASGAIIFQSSGGEARPVASVSEQSSSTPARPSCHPTPQCPAGNHPAVCRRPCPEGGYFYQMVSSRGCLDGTEPDRGRCLAGNYVDHGGIARMQPGARRPGQVNHKVTSTVGWTCKQLPALTTNVPERQSLEFSYERPPWGRGPRGVRDGILDLAPMRAFVQSLRSDEVDITPCLQLLRYVLASEFRQQCQIVEEAAGQPAAQARDFCRGQATEHFLNPFFAELARKELEIARAAPVRPLILIGEPETNPDSSDDTSAASTILRECRLRMKDLTVYGDSNGAASVLEKLGELMGTARPAVTDECRKKIFLSYMETLNAQQRNACAGAVERRPPMCQQIRLSTARTLEQLARIFPAEMGNESARSLVARACVLPGVDIARELQSLALQTETIGDCVNLAQGESTVINHDFRQSPSRVTQRYRLSRPNANTYRAAINLVFSPTQTSAPMLARVNKCLKKVNKKLLGPGGKRLELEIVNNDPAIPPSPIQVMGNNHRSNSIQWEGDIDCETITHELMHLMGLVDEYHEGSIGHVFDARTGQVISVSSRSEGRDKGSDFRPEFNCRVEGPEDSLMSNHEEAFDESSGWFRSRDSLLYTAHFNAIVFPGCTSVNRLYYLCARYAYDTSLGNYGRGCANGRPAECVNGARWLGGTR